MSFICFFINSSQSNFLFYGSALNNSSFEINANYSYPPKKYKY